MRRLLTPAAILLLHALGDAEACPAVPRERYEPRSFLGYACAGDCEQHKAGFAWAESHGVADPAACANLDGPASEGCRAHAEHLATSEDAGYEWAAENEIAEACLCGGAGERFRNGCLQQVLRDSPGRTR